MMKQLCAAATALALGTGVHAQQFTPVTPTYSATEQAAVDAALTPSSVANAIAQFDSASPQMGHPRLFAGQADYAGIVAATKAERAVALTSLTNYLKRNSVMIEANVPESLRNQINSSDESVRTSTWWQQNRMLEGMSEAATAWHFTKDAWFLSEMRARMNLFGPAVLARKCTGKVQETRDYVWNFALAYDMAYSAMTTGERQMVKDIITACGNSGLLTTPDTAITWPERSLEYQALSKFVGALLIVRGEHPAVDGWLERCLTTYINTLSPWGGTDGGFANGSTYGQWDVSEAVLQFDLIERVLNIPLYKKQWLAEFSRFVAYALPPGTPAGAFGDGAEARRPEEWARFGKSILNRSSTSLSRWYVKQLSGEDYARLNILLSPREYGTITSLPATQPNGAYFGSVGWATMHSSLADINRTSVLFKSSPFGSLNHSHGDQNSLVVYSKGKVLAMDSGHYDYYNSPHWRDWYKQTKAHNAITFDGGQGQYMGVLGLGEKSASGRLTRFLTNPAYDITIGEASAAYAGQLKRATRTVVFIRPSTIVTVDQLDSDTPRKYEYNLHTPVAISGTAAGFRADAAPAEMCGTVASPDVLEQMTSNGYAPAPTTTAAPHFWHKFGFTTAKTKGLIVSVLRTDCSTAKPVIAFAGPDGATINAAGRVIKVTDADVTVE